MCNQEKCLNRFGSPQPLRSDHTFWGPNSCRYENSIQIKFSCRNNGDIKGQIQMKIKRANKNEKNNIVHFIFGLLPKVKMVYQTYIEKALFLLITKVV